MKEAMTSRDLMKGYIANEQRMAMLSGIGYIFLMMGFMVGNGIFDLPREGKILLTASLILLAFVLVFSGSYMEKEIYKQVKKGEISFEEKDLQMLDKRYQKMKFVYLFVYIASLFGILSIIGRTFFIIYYYRACPKNDPYMYALGGLAMFCYIYAGGIMGAYRFLLKKKKMA